MSAIKVKLVRSRAGRSADHLATLAGLGLYRLGQERLLPDNASTLGMCEKLKHMVAWERVQANAVKRPARRKAKKAAAEQAR